MGAGCRGPRRTKQVAVSGPAIYAWEQKYGRVLCVWTTQRDFCKSVSAIGYSVPSLVAGGQRTASPQSWGTPERSDCWTVPELTGEDYMCPRAVCPLPNQHVPRPCARRAPLSPPTIQQRLDRALPRRASSFEYLGVHYLCSHPPLHPKDSRR